MMPTYLQTSLSKESVPFTQYLRPDGRPIPVWIDRPDHIAERAREIIAAGFQFEIEILMTGDVSMTIHNVEDGEDVAIEVCANGPDVVLAVDRLVKNFTLPRKES